MFGYRYGADVGLELCSENVIGSGSRTSRAVNVNRSAFDGFKDIHNVGDDLEYPTTENKQNLLILAKTSTYAVSE